MYAKLFSRITESSIIEESITTRWVFVAMLAIADSDGTVIGTDVAIARRINVPLSDFESSMKVLMAPDEHSNNQEFEGRRIMPSVAERGYFLTGYAKYRNLKTEDERRSYMKEYMAQRRSCKHSVNSVNISLAQLTHTEAEADTNAEADTIPAGNGDKNGYFEVFWKSYPKKIGKGAALKAWNKIKPSLELSAQIMASVEAQRTCEQWSKDNGQFIPNPSTWLNQERWNDEGVETVKSKSVSDSW